MINMSSVSDIAKKALESEDTIEKTFEGRMDGKGGYLVMSNKKLMFVREEGFLRKSYNVALEIPYEKIGKISVEQDGMNLVDTEGKRNVFKPFYLTSISVIEKSLQSLIVAHK